MAATPTGNKVLNAGSPAWKTVMLQRMNDRVGRFLATGARVILLLEPPAVLIGKITKAVSNSTAYEQMNALLREVAARHPHDVAVVNLQSLLCSSGPPCPYVVDGFGSISHPRKAIRPDGSTICRPGHSGLPGGWCHRSQGPPGTADDDRRDRSPCPSRWVPEPSFC